MSTAQQKYSRPAHAEAGSLLTDTGRTGVDTVDASFTLDPGKVVGTDAGAMRCALRGEMKRALTIRGKVERVRLGNDPSGDTVDLHATTAKRSRLTWYLGGGDDEFTGPEAGSRSPCGRGPATTSS